MRYAEILRVLCSEPMLLTPAARSSVVEVLASHREVLAAAGGAGG